jgi:hypothetical protein
MKADELIRKNQIASYFEKIQALLKKETGDDAAQPCRQGGGFSVGSTSTTTTTTDVKGGVRRPAAASTTEKTAMFSSQLSNNNNSPPRPRTVEEEKSNSAARCLAVLGVTPPSSSVTLTQEEIEKSRLLREQEIMKQYETIKRIEEERANIRPLVWDKPTFCPFGGETKSDDEDSSDDKSSSSSNKKRKDRDEKSSSRSRVMETCSNLLSKSNTSSAHRNLFPNYNMYGMMSASSVTYRTEWTKEEVDSFVAFTDKWILPKEKKIKLNHDEDDDTSSSSTSSSSKTTTKRMEHGIRFPGLL